MSAFKLKKQFFLIMILSGIFSFRSNIAIIASITKEMLQGTKNKT